MINCRIYISCYPFQKSNTILNNLSTNWTKSLIFKPPNSMDRTAINIWSIDSSLKTTYGGLLISQCRFEGVHSILFFRCFKVIKSSRTARWLRKSYFIKILFTVSRDTCTLPLMLKFPGMFLAGMGLFFKHMRRTIICQHVF